MGHEATHATGPRGEERPARLELPAWGRMLRLMLPRAFSLVGHARFKVHLRGVAHFRNRPGTLIVLNHKSDYDLILLIPALYAACRGRGPMGEAAFVAVEHMFQPGYVSSYLLRRPELFRRMLHPANMSALFQALGAYPVPHCRQRKLATHLRQIEEGWGNLPLRDIFREPPERLFGALPADARIRDVLRWRYHRVLYSNQGFSIFRGDLERSLRARHLKEIHASLDLFAEVLNQGRCLFIAPEGTLSKEGSFGEIKAGLNRLVRQVDRELVLQPVNLSYDTMTSGRPTAFVSVGPEIRDLHGRSKNELDQEVRSALVRQSVVSLSQLASQVLQERCGDGPMRLDKQHLRHQVWEQAHRLQEQGVTVDERLLESASFDRRWGRFLTYCYRRKIFRPAPGYLSYDPGPGRTAGGSPWAYGANEMGTLLETVAPAEPVVESV